MRIIPKEEKLNNLAKQKNRRFLKTHLPVDALVFSPKAKYIYIGRDGRDVVKKYSKKKKKKFKREILNDKKKKL